MEITNPREVTICTRPLVLLSVSHWVLSSLKLPTSERKELAQSFFQRVSKFKEKIVSLRLLIFAHKSITKRFKL